MNGKKLKEMLNKLGITQRSLAEKMNVTPQTISAFLSASDIRTSTIERISAVTGMPVSYWYGEASKEQSAVATGNGIAVTGNNNVAGNVTNSDTNILQERVILLQRILEEKERLIQVLIKQNN